MGKKYRLIIHNNSTYTGQVIIHQQKPQSDIVPDQIHSLAWLAARIYAKQGSAINTWTFEWTDDYGFVWAPVGKLEPGVRFCPAQIVPIGKLTPPWGNQITFTKEQLIYSFINPTTGADGSISIRSEPPVVAGEASIGYSMSGSSVCAAGARPRFSYWFTPRSGYVVSLGAYEQGDVIDPEKLAANNPFDFPEGVTTLEFTYNEDGTWTSGPPGVHAQPARAEISPAPAAPSYYEIVLGANIPHGSGILNRPCSVVFPYPGGAHSPPYTGTVLAWPTQNTIRMQSAYMNIEAAWVGANGGTLTIDTTNGMLNYPIIGFTNITLAQNAVSASNGQQTLAHASP